MVLCYNLPVIGGSKAQEDFVNSIPVAVYVQSAAMR